MTDKEKIRADIIRRIKKCMEDGTQIAGYCRIELEDVLDFIDSMQEEPTSKFDSCIQPGDDIRYNEELGCRVNISQLQRVAKKDPKYCMYSKDIYTDEERKSLCDGCEEDCEYNQKKEPDELTHSVTKISDQEEPVSDDLEEASCNYRYNFFGHLAERGRRVTSSNAMKNVENHFKAGARWQKRQMMKNAVDITVGFRFHRLTIDLKDNGIEGLEYGDKVKLIIIKED